MRNKCCELVWVPATEGVVPFGALQGGKSKDNEPLFIARAIHDEATTIGWVKEIILNLLFQFLNKQSFYSGKPSKRHMLVFLRRRGTLHDRI